MVPTRGWFLMFGTLSAGCSDYDLRSPTDPVVPTSTGETGIVTSDTQTILPPTGDTGVTVPTPTGDTAVEAPTCADTVLPVFGWRASPIFAQQADPRDGGGRPFWDPDADTSSFVAVATPDRGIPIGFDRAYVANFDLTELPVNLSLDLQSDDGIWVWVNGVEVGHWGGDWQEEGCVNENAECLVATEVPAVDVTPLLQVGGNTIAARVSNPVQSGYFDILPRCVEP